MKAGPKGGAGDTPTQPRTVGIHNDQKNTRTRIEGKPKGSTLAKELNQ